MMHRTVIKTNMCGRTSYLVFMSEEEHDVESCIEEAQRIGVIVEEDIEVEVVDASQIQFIEPFENCFRILIKNVEEICNPFVRHEERWIKPLFELKDENGIVYAREAPWGPETKMRLEGPGIRRYTVFAEFQDCGIEEVDVDADSSQSARKLATLMYEIGYQPGWTIVKVEERFGLYW